MNITNVKRTIRSWYKTVTKTLLTYPERSFFGTLGVLLLVIIIGNFLRRPPSSNKDAQPAPRQVHVFSIGSAPKVKLTAKIEKSGAIKIVALTGGVVQFIHVSEGSTVARGQTLFSLSTNYQGGVLPGATRQIAEANNALVNDTFDGQIDTIYRQRNQVQTVYNQAEDLRAITSQSIADTQSLIAFNTQLAASVDSQLSFLESTNIDHANDALILQVSQAKSGIASGLLSLNASLRNSQYQIDPNNAPANLASQQKDIALAQLVIQEKSLRLNREIAGLNLKIAQISEAMMFPAAPISGTIERIYVNSGAYVNPGTVLATLAGSRNSVTAIVAISNDMAANISTLDTSALFIRGNSVEVQPKYISKEPTEGSFHSVIFAVPDSYAPMVSNGSSIQVEIPIGSTRASAVIPYVPLDSIYQSQTDAYIYTATPSAGITIAKSLPVTLGTVYGSFVEVTGGLGNGDQVILDRNVVDGEHVEIVNK